MTEQNQNPEPQNEAPVQSDVQQALTAAGPSDDDLNMAMLAHLLAIVLGFLGPLVIWLMNKDKSDKDFVNDQAKEALNFQITLLIGYAVSFVLSFIVIGVFLMLILMLVSLVLSILAGLAAKKGEAYRYPFAVRLIK